jgi:hypothetical protein
MSIRSCSTSMLPSMFAIVALTAVPAIAAAQNTSPGDARAVGPTGATALPTGAPPAGDDDRESDGVRFRGGASGGGGFWTGSNLTAGLGGGDGRLGVQINHYLAVYGQVHFSGGVVSQGRASGGTGVFAGSGLVEVTLLHRLFIAAGGGAGVLNNPGGGMLHFRLGGYPLMGFGENGARRKGLMVGADLRIVFVTGLTAIMPFFSVGYEAF